MKKEEVKTKEDVKKRKEEAMKPETAMKEHELNLPLNDHLKAEIADELLKIQREKDERQQRLDEWEERKKQERSVFTDDLRALNQQFEEAFLALKEGYLKKVVKCKKVKDPENGIVNFYDADGKKIHTQEMIYEDGVFTIEDEFETKKEEDYEL